MTSPDADSLSTYGGAKQNYGVAPVDPTTDDDASAINQMKATVAMNSRTSPRVEVAFLGHATTPTIDTWEAVWKAGTGTAPIPAHSATGIYTLTLPTSVNDELGVAHTLNLTRAWGQAEGSTAYQVQCKVTSPNVITAWVFNAAGAAANDAAGVTLVVWAR